jgi:acetylornithine deacetylase/succinyl-diaminopimelate desuccinylase-like protein
MGLVLTEGGVVEAMSYDQIKYWGIEFGQKRFARIVFCGSDRERLEELRRLLLRTGRIDPYPRVAAPVRTFLASYSRTRGLGSFHALLADPDRTVRHRAAFDRLTPFMEALFRDEVAPFLVEASPSGGYELKVVAHLLPGEALEPLLEGALPEWKRFGVTWTVDPVLGTDAVSPVDSADFRSLVASVSRAVPSVSVGPYFLPWAATDSRFFRELGVPSYGFSPFPLTVTETLQMGKPNERMQLPAYVRGVELYRDAVGALAEAPWTDR